MYIYKKMINLYRRIYGKFAPEFGPAINHFLFLARLKPDIHAEISVIN